MIQQIVIPKIYRYLFKTDTELDLKMLQQIEIPTIYRYLFKPDTEIYAGLDTETEIFPITKG